MPQQNQRTLAWIGLFSIFSFALMLTVFPLLPYAYLLPWVEGQSAPPPPSPEERPAVVLIFLGLVFLPLNSLGLFWAWMRQLLPLGPATLPWYLLSGYLLNASFICVLAIFGVALYGQFYAGAEDEVIMNILALLFILWGLMLDFGALCLCWAFFPAGWFSPNFRRLSLQLIAAQIALDLLSINTEAPALIFFAATLPLPLLILLISAQWLVFQPWEYERTRTR